MEEFLTQKEKDQLIAQHRKEKNRRVADRIKTVLLFNKGWSYREIAEALLLDEQTISDHVKDYQSSKKLTINSGGSTGKLEFSQVAELKQHLELKTYVKTEDICEYVNLKYDVQYSVSGMTSWLHSHNFSFKKPKKTPAKTDTKEQEKFINSYNELISVTPQNEPILFLDGVHPTMATKVTHGWIKKGFDKPIATTASRTRVNLIGTINLNTMDIVAEKYETINSDSMENYFDLLKKNYPESPKIHLILDRGPYNISIQTKIAAEKRGITLHHLPPYSPNLNPIERVWKVMNEKVRNNQFFKSAKDFRQSITDFFDITWPQIKFSMRNRINDNFQRLNPAV